MQCYTELLPPSGVTHALALPFTSWEASNLIVARTSLLQVFSVKPTDHGQDAKLVLVAEYSLSGTITSMKRVKILNPNCGEAVLVAFRDAKLSLIEWDPEKHSISTISIHYYEAEALRRSPWTPDLQDGVNHLTVDPSSRCAVFHFGMTNVAIIPFHQLGDDLVMDDYEADFDADHNERSTSRNVNGGVAIHQTPYASSFVLPLTALDPGLLHTVHLDFLHEYREPTFGILYSSVARSAALGFERKDVIHYGVFTLDLEQRASTVLLSIARLPNDLFAVIPLPLPVGGALLLGTNELIHVDQGGKTNGMAVNEFARQVSSFSMADHSGLRLRLEGCQVQQLNASTGDMLIVLVTGDLALLNFRLDGRSVSGVSIRVLPQDLGNILSRSRASCVAALGGHLLFIGSEVADSVLISTARKVSQLKKHSSRGGPRILNNSMAKTVETEANQEGVADVEEEDDDEEEEEEGEDEDDLYGDVVEQGIAGQPEIMTAPGANLRVLDRLYCIGPLRDVTIGRVNRVEREVEGQPHEDQPPLSELVAVSGEGKAGGVTILHRELRHEIVGRINIPRPDRVWSFSLKSNPFTSDTCITSRAYDDFMIASSCDAAGSSESTLYAICGGSVEERVGTDFDPSGETVDCGSILDGAHLVQVLETVVRVYDQAFGLAQILEVVDEESNATAKSISASFADPYVLVMKEDHSILLLRADSKGELDEVELNAGLANTAYVSATLYKDRKGVFVKRGGPQNLVNGPDVPCTLATLSSHGAFSIYALTGVQSKIFHYDGVGFLPPVLADSKPPPRHWKGAQTPSEILLADLGDGGDAQPHLILRSSANDIIIYHPFRAVSTAQDGGQRTVSFRKVNSRWIPKTTPERADSDDEGPSKSLQPLKAIFFNGLFAVIVSGASPAIVTRRAACSPRIYHLATGPTSYLSGYHTAWCPEGLAHIDEHGNLSILRIPPEICIGQSDWLQRKVELGLNVTGISYFGRTRSYVLATSTLADFQLPQDDEWHAEWRNENITCLPRVEQGWLQLLSSATFNVMDSFQLDPAERAMCIKTMLLEVSEETHEKKDLIVVGTAITKGEDMVTRGAIYIFDIVDVVPQPGIPETDLKLKLVAKEEVKGAVTSISPIGSQGFMLAAQGQKCMVRGLKEDLSILPVAFMDMKYYVNIVKELPGTGLCILGDAVDGLWFVGYSEEPYKLQLFGRDQVGLEVMAAEFLPVAKGLYLLAADGDGHLHVMQFDPESPGSERGTKLLHRSTFTSGSLISTMTLLPGKGGSAAEGPDSYGTSSAQPSSDHSSQQILLTSQEGCVGLITSLPEQTYRRLLALQNTLTANLEHTCGLNPRAYRAVETDGIGGAAILDGNLVQRWLDQDVFHQKSMADKVGSMAWEVKEDLQDISGGGLVDL